LKSGYALDYTIQYLFRLLLILWSNHQQQPWEILDEDQSNPLGHAMSTGCLEGPVERDDRVDDTADVHQDGEQ